MSEDIHTYFIVHIQLYLSHYLANFCFLFQLLFKVLTSLIISKSIRFYAIQAGVSALHHCFDKNSQQYGKMKTVLKAAKKRGKRKKRVHIILKIILIKINIQNIISKNNNNYSFKHRFAKIFHPLILLIIKDVLCQTILCLLELIVLH